ncbi:hypothetical protein ACMD2_11965 [Ananas comosus]|uniref:Uncharacterized protein n=1 Tax=Ananas comosus TaxID=4615 RepID=A0A199VG70_ANACO|nr:hypothetical protein ACMD2_11965 [Ananas comosus]
MPRGLFEVFFFFCNSYRSPNRVSVAQIYLVAAKSSCSSRSSPSILSIITISRDSLLAALQYPCAIIISPVMHNPLQSAY